MFDYQSTVLVIFRCFTDVWSLDSINLKNNCVTLSITGIRINDLIKLAVDERNVDPVIKQNNIKSLSVHLEKALEFHRRTDKRRLKPYKYLKPLNLPYSALFVRYFFAYKII